MGPFASASRFERRAKFFWRKSRTSPPTAQDRLFSASGRWSLLLPV